MNFSADMQIIELDSFDTAFPVEPGKESAVKRRFMTLFAAGEQAQVGGTSYVRKVQSFTGEVFALKRLLTGAGVPEDANLTPEDTARITQGHAAAFYEEYKNQLLVSRMRGFPKLYGYGTIGDDPAILMEWVEGVSLRDFARNVRADGGSVSALTAATIGVSVLDVLESAARLDTTLVHRDISPANVMIRTTAAQIDAQAQRGAYDVCLIDFGSAAASAPQDASFTMVAQVWRNGTPEYAAPEMLTQDIPHIDELRKSQAIDVFALCSVLYELYAEHTPWRVSEHPEVSPFRLKMENAPEPIALRDPVDAPFADAVMAGLAADQAARPSARELAQALRSFVASQGGPLAGAQDAGSSSAGAAGSAEGAAAGGPSTLAEALPVGLYTPDSTHLKMASAAEGGKRASEDVPAFDRSQAAGISRRSFVVGGLAFAAIAVAGSAVAARSCRRAGDFDFSAYPTASSPYDGDVLYLAMRNSSNAWSLLDAQGCEMVALGNLEREPGAMAGGIVRMYDEATGRYGFVTPVPDAASGASSSAGSASPVATRSGTSASADSSSSDGGPSAALGGDPSAFAWLALPRYLAAGDFSLADEAVSESTGEGAAATGVGDAASGSVRMAAVRDAETGLWGYIDMAGEYAIEPSFAGAGRFRYGFAPVQAADSKLWSFIGASGAAVCEAQFARLGTCSDVGLVAAAGTSTAQWGFVDTAGDWAIPDNFARVQRFSEGLAAVKQTGGLWGFIDTRGEVAVSPQFADVRPFGGGLAPAQDAATMLWGLIDDTGAWRVSPRYLKMGDRTGGLFPAHGSPANVYDRDAAAWDEYLAAGNADAIFGYGYADADGTWAISPVFGDVLIRQPEM